MRRCISMDASVSGEDSVEVRELSNSANCVAGNGER